MRFTLMIQLYHFNQSVLHRHQLIVRSLLAIFFGFQEQGSYVLKHMCLVHPGHFSALIVLPAQHTNFCHFCLEVKEKVILAVLFHQDYCRHTKIYFTKQIN